MIDREKVLKLAMLARVKLTEEELQTMQVDLNDIFQYLDILNEVDTSTVAPTYQTTGVENVEFADEVAEQEVSPDDLLNCSEFEIVDHQIQTNSILN